MKKLFNKETGLTYLYMLFAALLVCANCIATKQIPIGTWFGRDISITVGILCYPFTFLITDIIGERYGKEKANHAVIGGFIGQIVAIILVTLANLIPGNSSTVDASFSSILGANWILTIGSLTACLLSQSWDVWVFHKIRDAYVKKHGSTKGGRWIWNNVGTITSQLIDTVIFQAGLVIMLGVNSGYWMSFGDFCVTALVYWLFKTVIAILDTPLFYLFTKERKATDER